MEKLTPKHEVRVLRNNLKNHDKDVEELEVEALRQSDRYNELRSTHRMLFEVVQALRSQVIVLRSGGRVESIRGSFGGANPDPEGLSSRPRGLGRQPRRSTVQVESSDSWHERSRRCSKDQSSGRRRD